MSLLQLDRVSKAFWRGAHKLVVLDDVSLALDTGAFVAVHGGRRTGKTTLLTIASGLMTPDTGAVRFNGADLSQLSEREHTQLLGEQLAWVRCDEAPPEGMRIVDHVATPLLIQHGRKRAERCAVAALTQVGAERCARTTWDRLPDVERALVSIARGLVRQPVLLLVDDPTVGLELEDRERVIELLRSEAETTQLGVLMTTADKPATRRAHQVLSLRRGRLAGAGGAPADEGRGKVIRFPRRGEGPAAS